jgi:hypothetical protein
MGPRSSLDGMKKRKILPLPEIDRRPSTSWPFAFTTELHIWQRNSLPVKQVLKFPRTVRFFVVYLKTPSTSRLYILDDRIIDKFERIS